MSLRDLQAALTQRVTGGDADRALEPAVQAREPGSNARIAVYEELVLEAHLDTLAQAFPVTLEVVGAGYWRTLLRELWDRPGSDSANLESYGDFVPSALTRAVAERPELAELPYLPELAALEWAVHVAIGRTGPERFDWAAFAQLSEAEQAGATLLPSPALTKRSFRFPVDDIWRRHRGRKTETGEGQGPFVCCLHPSGRFEIEVTRWDSAEEPLLDRLLHGVSLESLAALGSTEGVARLHGWIEAGWIIGFAHAG